MRLDALLRPRPSGSDPGGAARGLTAGELLQTRHAAAGGTDHEILFEHLSDNGHGRRLTRSSRELLYDWFRCVRGASRATFPRVLSVCPCLMWRLLLDVRGAVGECAPCA
jgi:hypothetical protein